MSEASQNLRAFSDGMDKKLFACMAKACKTVQTAARHNVPVDTGNLRRSIDFEVGDGGREGIVFTNCEYAPYVELGTSRMAAQPFLEPAINQSRSDILNAFKGLV